VKNLIENSQNKILKAGLSDSQFIHRKLQNPPGNGRSSDLLCLFSTPSRSLWDEQWLLVETLIRAYSSGNCSRISRLSLLSVSGTIAVQR
jgi:hypothetical protein